MDHDSAIGRGGKRTAIRRSRDTDNTTAVTLIPLTEDHRVPVIDIFNHYVEHSDAAYPENVLPYVFYDHFLKLAEGYPALAVQTPDGRIVGFGMLRAYHAMSTFSNAAEVSCFLHPDFCRRGLGALLLSRLLEEGKRMGLATILANIASDNRASIRFHRKQGFIECGRFKSILRKRGRASDIVWMQKML